MKIWYSYGSEHSMNLVMIGHFNDVRAAQEAKDHIDSITDLVNAEIDAGELQAGNPPDKFTPRMLDLLNKIKFHIITPSEFEQFAYEFDVNVDENKVVVKTEESEVSALLKLLVDKGARVEVYSAHHYPDTPYGRGK
jgi:hypothetical protein